MNTKHSYVQWCDHYLFSV